MERLEGHSAPTSSPAPPPPPPPRNKIARRKTRSSGSGNSGGGSNNYRNNSLQRRSYSGGGQRSTSDSTPRTTSSTSKVVTPVAPPKPAPPPGNATFLRSDSTYQRQLASYAKALADFQAEQGLSRTDYDTGYQNQRRDIGLAKGDALKGLENDYAARGMLRSSLYNTDVGKLTQEYGNQFTDLDKQRTAFLDQLTQQLGGYKNEQNTQQQNAMQEALRRRAEQYNL